MTSPSAGKSCCNKPFLWSCNKSSFLVSAVIRLSKFERNKTIFSCSLMDGNPNLNSFNIVVVNEVFPQLIVIYGAVRHVGTFSKGNASWRIQPGSGPG